MSEAEAKLEKIKHLLDQVEKGIKECRQVLRGEQTCSGCRFWSGTCQKGKVNRVAADAICELFELRGGNW